MKKNVKKIIKKHLTGVTLFFGILFLVIGVVLGFIVFKALNKEGNTKIELNGETIVTLNVGDSYEELGVTYVIDDKDYSSEVVISGNVDTTVNGRYLLTYTLDKDEHVIVLTRVVNVIGGVSDGE